MTMFRITHIILNSSYRLPMQTKHNKTKPQPTNLNFKRTFKQPI